MSRTQHIEDVSAVVQGVPTILYAIEIDDIMVYVDATPEDEDRRRKLASLVAATPNLFEACKAFVADCDVDVDHNWGTCEWSEWVANSMKRIKAAITETQN